MSEGKGNARLAELLREIEAEGGTVTSGGKETSALTRDALANIGAQPDFEAWISWTKSF